MIVNAQAVDKMMRPIKTEIRKTEVGYQLYRGGQPYFIKGAGGSTYPDRIAGDLSLCLCKN